MITTLTVDGVDYPSYATLAEADDQLRVDPRLSGSWPRLLDPPPPDADRQCAVALIAATRALDALPWQGTPKGGEPQRRTAWPRDGVRYRDGSPVDVDLPDKVEAACIILAGASFLPGAEDSALDPNAIGAQSAKRLKAGAVEIEYFAPAGGAGGAAPGLSDAYAWRLVLEFLGSRQPAAEVTGVGEGSHFDDAGAPRPIIYP